MSHILLTSVEHHERCTYVPLVLFCFILTSWCMMECESIIADNGERHRAKN